MTDGGVGDWQKLLAAGPAFAALLYVVRVLWTRCENLQARMDERTNTFERKLEDMNKVQAELIAQLTRRLRQPKSTDDE